MTAVVKEAELTSRRTRRNMMAIGAGFWVCGLGQDDHSARLPARSMQVELLLEGHEDPEPLKASARSKTSRSAICCRQGSAGCGPVQWIGRYSFRKRDPSKPWVEDVLPVRIARSALGPNVPHADLFVTARHSLLIDGVLAPAEMLINGTTISRHEASETDELEYFHIKLESHDVIYAEGAPAETLCSVDESAVNFAEYFRQYGMPKIEENALRSGHPRSRPVSRQA